jgi:sugar phosphate isomerase/epimerase
MKTSRRAFLKDGSITLAAALLSPRIFAAQKATDHILGIQLYSIRDDMEKDPAGTLEQLAAMGYTHVEHAGYEDGKFYGYTPNKFKSLLHDLGLKMLSGHSGLDAKKWNKAKNDFTDEWKQMVLA